MPAFIFDDAGVILDADDGTHLQYDTLPVAFDGTLRGEHGGTVRLDGAIVFRSRGSLRFDRLFRAEHPSALATTAKQVGEFCARMLPRAAVTWSWRGGIRADRVTTGEHLLAARLDRALRGEHLSAALTAAKQVTEFCARMLPRAAVAFSWRGSLRLDRIFRGEHPGSATRSQRCIGEHLLRTPGLATVFQTEFGQFVGLPDGRVVINVRGRIRSLKNLSGGSGTP